MISTALLCPDKRGRAEAGDRKNIDRSLFLTAGAVGTNPVMGARAAYRLTLPGGCLYNEAAVRFFHLVSVAQLAERRTVAPVVEGSSPSTHPIPCEPL